MKLADFNTDDKVFVVAEIGNNHEGDFDIAKEMILQAKASGADAVKFQTFIPEEFVSVTQTERLNRLKKFQFRFSQFEELKLFCDQQGIIFFSTPLDLKSARFLIGLVDFIKISSSDNNFYPLLKILAESNKPLILSTGLMDMSEVNKSIDYLKNIWQSDFCLKDRLALLHCISEYPVAIDDINLNALHDLSKTGCTVGYSDHSLGIDAAIYSVAAGARIVEKHFTLDKNYSDFRDHALSADPVEFKIMVDKIRLCERYLGKQSKSATFNEKKSIPALRRSLIAITDLNPGDVLSDDNTAWVRPAGGIDTSDDMIIGRKVIKRVAAYQQIDYLDL